MSVCSWVSQKRGLRQGFCACSLLERALGSRAGRGEEHRAAGEAKRDMLSARDQRLPGPPGYS